MTPNDTHLELLRSLPAEVQEKLRSHGPGWVIHDSQHAPRQCVLRPNPKSWEIEPPWLPCDPTAILRVAEEMHGGDDLATWLEHIPDRAVPHEASVAADRDRQLFAHGNDAHEAALRLLLAVCGGEG